MITKPLLLALLAACGVPSNTATIESPPTEQPDKQPPDDPGLEDQHFCCQSISEKEFSGDGCTAISKEAINSCPNVLYCPDAWKKKDGNVTCE